MHRSIDNQHCQEQEMVGTRKEYHQNFLLAAKSVKVASELTCLVDSTDQEWPLTAKGTRHVSIGNFFQLQISSLAMKEKTFKQQPSCSSQESPYILQLRLMIWRPPHTECLGCQLKMNVNSNYLCSSLILQSSGRLLCY